jgi:hypothetical protein
MVGFVCGFGSCGDLSSTGQAICASALPLALAVGGLSAARRAGLLVASLVSERERLQESL